MAVRGGGLMRFGKILWTVVIISSFILLLIYAGALILSHAQDIYGIEQNVVYSLQLILNDNPLYTHPELPPYNVVQYTPAYYAIVDVLASLFRVEARNVYGVYVLARSVAAAFGIGVCVIIWYICKNFGGKGIFLFTTFVFALLAPMPWFLSVRPDSMAAFFEFLALFFFIQYLQKEDKSPQRLLLTGAALAFSLYSKQTAVIFLGLFLVFPFYKQWLKDRLLLSGGFGLGLLLVALIFMPYANIFPGADNYFYRNIIDGVTNTLSFERALWVYQFYIMIFFGFFLLPLWVSGLTLGQLWRDAAGNLPGLWTQYAKLERVFTFLLFIFWGDTLIALVMAFKSASAINYFNESMLLAILLVSWFMSHPSIPKEWQKSARIRWGMGLLMLVSIVAIGRYLFIMYGTDVVSDAPEAQSQETLDVLEAEFRVYPESYFIYFPKSMYERWLNLYAFENTLFQPREVYDVSYFDLSSLQTYLDDGTVIFLVTDKGPFPDDVYGYKNLQDYFEIWHLTDNYMIYRNRNSD
jgi:hypothetical protein